MARNRNTGGVRLAAVRSRLRRGARRAIGYVGPLDGVARRASEGRKAYARLLALYEDLRSSRTADELRPSPLPSASEISIIQREVLRATTFQTFFETFCADGDFDRAAVSITRKLIARGRRNEAVSMAQVLQRYDGLRPIGDICVALCALTHPMPETAWTLFTRNDLALVLRWAPADYFGLAFWRDAAHAAADLGRVVNGEVPLETDPHTWLDIAYASFSAGSLDLTGQTLRRAEDALPRMANRERRNEATARLTTLREWLGRAGSAGDPVAAPAGEVPFALVGFKHPDWREMSRDLNDPLEALAALGHLARHEGVRFSGDPDLVTVADNLRNDVPRTNRINSDEATVRLYEVDRDLSRYAAVPDGTWMIVSDWFRLPLAGERFDVPLDPRIRPIFLSFYIGPGALATPGAVEYLRRYAPIGCRDRDTVYLLLAAGVPAFFSGALTMTVDTVVPRGGSAARSGTVFVDVRPNGRGERRTRLLPAIKRRGLAENLTAAADALRAYRDGGARVVTSDPRFYLAVRAVGCRAELRPQPPFLSRAVDFTSVDDREIEALQRGIRDKLAAVLGAVLAGRAETEVYAAWREACAADVTQAESELHSITGERKLDFDVDKVCEVIRAASVVVERADPGPGGHEVNVEFSLDGNYKHQLDIVLDSVVENASRPVRAFVLCRDHGRDDFDRMARLFPTVSFVWLPTDDVGYGRVGGMNNWVTSATMDRTILSVLLDDVDRIIHHDLDTLCLGDLAELFDVDMEGTAIAAATTPQPRFLSGFNTFRRNAERLRGEGHAELARELILRTHAMHAFDFDVFNAGVMLMDLNKMRADDFCGRILPYVQTFGLNGQVVLNTYVGRDRKVIGNEWNRLIRLEADEHRKICHWVGEYKPWRSDVYVTGRELWQAQEQRFAARAAEYAAVAEAVGGPA